MPMQLFAKLCNLPPPRPRSLAGMLGAAPRPSAVLGGFLCVVACIVLLNDVRDYSVQMAPLRRALRS